jgi:hypothetical protein
VRLLHGASLHRRLYLKSGIPTIIDENTYQREVVRDILETNLEFEIGD